MLHCCAEQPRSLQLILLPQLTLQVPPDRDTLRRVSEITGGKYYEADTGTDLGEVYEKLGSTVGYETVWREITVWFVLAAMPLLLLALLLSLLWFGRFP